MTRLIDADELNKKLLGRGFCNPKDDSEHGVNFGLQIAQQIIDAMPTVERPHGEWVYKNGKYWCSSCGEKAIYHSHIQAPLPHLTNFCPNCGADMRKEGDDK